MSDAVRELTPRGPGAVAVLEVRGAAARARLERLAGVSLDALRAPRLVRLRAPRSARPRADGAEEEGEVVDESLVLVRPDGTAELHLHGSPPLVDRVRALLAGVPPAKPGGPGPEPAGSVDSAEESLEERALALLAEAPCEAAARVLLDQAEGALRRALRRLGTCGVRERARRASALLATGRAARRVLEPTPVVLAGPVNAGKSTLFNALVGHRRVVVSDVPGTTRDVIRERGTLGPYPVEWIDGAGERDLAGGSRSEAVERAGQRLAAEARAAAGLVLRLEPVPPDGAPPVPAPGRRAPAPAGPEASGASAGPPEVLVWSCADRLRGGVARPEAAVAAAVDPGGAVATVERLFRAALAPPDPAWIPGAAVPFEAGQLAALAELAAAPSGRAGALLDRLLSPAPRAGGPAGRGPW